MAETNDHETKLLHWLQRWRSGDEQARDRLLEHTCEQLRQRASRMLRDYSRLPRWVETADVLQDALWRLHRSLADVKPESAAHYFNLASLQIRRALVDLARHHFGPHGDAGRHETNSPKAGQTDSPPKYETADRTTEPADVVAWSEFHEQVDRLPDEEREVFGLLWYQGLTQGEAAEVLQTSLRTINRRWQSARIHLAEWLDGKSPPI